MIYMPDFSPFGRGKRLPIFGYLTMFLMVLAGFILVRFRTIWSLIVSLSLFFIAMVLQKTFQNKNKYMTVQVSVLGVVWFHPAKGGGTLRWGNVGALSVTDKGPKGPIALILTPLSMEESPAMLVESSDLDSGPEKGREMLVGLAGEIMQKMPQQTVMDRHTRAWAGRMGLSCGKG